MYLVLIGSLKGDEVAASRSTIVVWDLETVPDAAALGRMRASHAPGTQALGKQAEDAFQKLPFHQIVCIGALIAQRTDGDSWVVRALGAPHTGERSEGEIIQGFVDRIAELRPQLVSFNGHGFDLPVLRYRAMVNSISAPGLSTRPYFSRFTDDALDLCDVLASYDGRSRVSLDAVSRFLRLAGKPGVDGADVAKLVRRGRVAEVAEYCETDVVNTYRVWLRYELFRGALDNKSFRDSEDDLSRFVSLRSQERPHLGPLVRKT